MQRWGTPYVEPPPELADISGVALDRLMGRTMPDDAELRAVQQQLERISGCIASELP